MSNNKNVSKLYKNGIKVQTRDNYLDKTNYYSPGHSNPKDLYRSTIVVDSNRNNELVLVPLTTHNKRVPRGSISDYIYVFDSNGNPIKLPSDKFKIRKGKSLSAKEVNVIKKKLFKTGVNASRNRYLVSKHIKKRSK